MEENNKNNKSKKIISIFLSVLILLIVIIGTSYAAWHYNFVGTLTNIISTPDLEIDLLESDDEIISLSNALPMTDEEGLAQNEEFHFAVTSKTTKEMLLGYTVMVEKLDPDTGYTFLNDQDIKIYLEDFNGNVLLEPTKISELNNYKLYVGAHSHNSQNELIQDKFKLKVWIDESKTEDARSWDINTKLQYKFKLGIRANETNALTVNAVVNNGSITGSTSVQVVEGGSAKFSMTPTDSTSEGIVSCTNNQTGTIKNNTLTVSNVTSDTTCTVTFTPSTTTLFTDGTLIINEKPSQRQSNITEHGAVTNEYQALSNSNSYVFNSYGSSLWNSQKSSIKKVQIGQKIQPTSTANWFAGLSYVSYGDFTNLDTSQVTNMKSMFEDTGANSALTSFHLIGLDDWDTSQVTNMYGTINSLGKYASDWDIGDLSNWDTSKVTTMEGMFLNVGYSVTTFNIGNLSNWDTSKVTNMRSMFSKAGYSATNWSIGNLSNWDTSNVTDMEYMFYQAGYNSTTWNSIGTLKVYTTDIYNIFLECPKAKATLNIYSNPTTYGSTFSRAATASDALITVNYSSATTNIDNIIATKSSNSNVVKGVQLD